MRYRMLEIARRRVRPDDAEDLVQQALRIVVESGNSSREASWPSDRPAVAWCLQVLRNVIGNHYRRRATRTRYIDEASDPEQAALPLEAMDAAERVGAIEAGLLELARSDANCGRYLGRLMDDAPVHLIAAENGLETNALYQRLYRCRRKLREILRRRGVLP